MSVSAPSQTNIDCSGTTAFITGINGQDGHYLALLLVEKGYTVHGLVRSTLDPELAAAGVIAHVCDMLDHEHLTDIISKVDPDELYNLAAQSSVVRSWEEPEYTTEVNYIVVLRILECLRKTNKSCKLFQASSMAMYGRAVPPFSEWCKFQPTSPYGIAKLAAHELCGSYREQYGMHIACGILFHHESPRRGKHFVTRKITQAVAKIKAGKQDKLLLGDLTAECDWGDARDMVRAMWMMLQQDELDDYILATGVTRSLKTVVAHVFQCADLDWKQFVQTDPALLRPKYDRHKLVVNTDKVTARVKWHPEFKFEDTLKEMLEHDMNEAEENQ